VRIFDRAAASEKKRELGLTGDLRGRHLPLSIRQSLLAIIAEAKTSGMSLEKSCRVLELNWRAVYRWKSRKHLKENHGGGGGKNKITPLEEKRILRLAKKFPQLRCRRIAYSLERNALAFVGKTKVAEVMKANGLNHQFVRGAKKPVEPPGEILLHEPWAPNLLWGMDWTWVHVGNGFYFLLVIVDWYSRLIVAWGLFQQITRFEVTATITDAVAAEKVDALPDGAMRPRIVADHGSANCAKYTRSNIEVQGLQLWLSGIGRPTGNARTERTIGTLKHEEISLQDQYSNEDEARQRITATIIDYNHRRPNAGNGGFAPTMIHTFGRKFMIERRENARQLTREKRRKHWDQEAPC
jgi:transposase InsO family protein